MSVLVDKAGAGVDHGRWWQQAACAGRPATWWTCDDRLMWPAAVRICLDCPVREVCLAEAIASQDQDVIRGGMWLQDTPRRGHHTVPLVCTHCDQQPVQITRDRIRRTCGRDCTRAAALVGIATT